MNLIYTNQKKQKEKQAYLLACLGLISWEQAQVKKAIESFELSLKIIDDVGDIYSRRMVEAILSLAFWRKGEWGKSLILLKNVLPLDIDSIPQTYFSEK